MLGVQSTALELRFVRDWFATTRWKLEFLTAWHLENFLASRDRSRTALNLSPSAAVCGMLVQISMRSEPQCRAAVG